MPLDSREDGGKGEISKKVGREGERETERGEGEGGERNTYKAREVGRGREKTKYPK